MPHSALRRIQSKRKGTFVQQLEECLVPVIKTGCFIDKTSVLHELSDFLFEACGSPELAEPARDLLSGTVAAFEVTAASQGHPSLLSIQRQSQEEEIKSRTSFTGVAFVRRSICLRSQCTS